MPPGPPAVFCRRGHVLSEDNVVWKRHARATTGWTRQCRTCVNHKNKMLKRRQRHAVEPRFSKYGRKLGVPRKSDYLDFPPPTTEKEFERYFPGIRTIARSINTKRMAQGEVPLDIRTVFAMAMEKRLAPQLQYPKGKKPLLADAPVPR